MKIKRNVAAAAFLAIIAVVFLSTMLFTHPFGVIDESAMDDYIIRNTQEQTGANNGVTAVVFDYRGFDTLGEATVLFTAVAAVLMLFRRLRHE
ncbi:MAG: hydrogen gas-evolving membrane-bound hydrogenase subunit E [Thermoplasmatota archaeon]